MRNTVVNVIRNMSKRQYNLLRTVTHRSKDVYNYALYNIRQEYIHNHTVLSYESNYHLCKLDDSYRNTHSTTGQATMKLASEAMSSFLGLRKLYKLGELEFRPKLPKYLDKTGHYVIQYTKRAYSIKGKHVVLSIPANLKQEYPDHKQLMSFPIPKQLLEQKHRIKQVNIIPGNNARYFKITFVYEPKNQISDVDPDKYMAIDLGVDNFATCVDSTGTAVIVDGKYIKSVNQYYNKNKARLQSVNDRQHIKQDTNRITKLTNRRNNILREFMNVTIKRLVDHCLEYRIGTILIGDLKGMKQQINLGKYTNQKIVQIPWYKFKQSLKSKCKRAGINFVLVDEAYTSQVDACAFDPIENPPYGRKRRIQRGLYKSSTGTLINADVNGALNIMRKVVGDFHVSEIIDRGLVNRPKRIRFGFFRPGWSSTNFS